MNRSRHTTFVMGLRDGDRENQNDAFNASAARVSACRNLLRLGSGWARLLENAVDAGGRLPEGELNEGGRAINIPGGALTIHNLIRLD
jgi:hypothetical protein